MTMSSVVVAVLGQPAEPCGALSCTDSVVRAPRSRDSPPAAPGPPVRLVFPEVRLSSVRVVWQPPEEPNGVILGKGAAAGHTGATHRGVAFRSENVSDV